MFICSFRGCNLSQSYVSVKEFIVFVFLPSFSNSFNSPLSQSSACKDIRLHSFYSVIQSQELENFLLRSMEKVDICIELVRIREFDGSGGRIELNSIIFIAR